MEVKEIDYSKVLELRQEVMYPNEDLEFVKIADDNLGIHLGICEGDVAASVVSIFLKDRDVQFRKLATREVYQNKGYATTLIESIIKYAKEMKLNKVWANSRVNIYPFYENLGFKKTGETFNKDGHDYVIIEYII